jgi:hypothetical protein
MPSERAGPPTIREHRTRRKGKHTRRKQVDLNGDGNRKKNYVMNKIYTSKKKERKKKENALSLAAFERQKLEPFLMMLYFFRMLRT